MEPARPTDELRPMFGLVCGNSRQRLATAAATSRFIPCLREAAHTRILIPTQALLLYTKDALHCNGKSNAQVILFVKTCILPAGRRTFAADGARARPAACPVGWAGSAQGEGANRGVGECRAPFKACGAGGAAQGRGAYGDMRAGRGHGEGAAPSWGSPSGCWQSQRAVRALGKPASQGSCTCIQGAYIGVSGRRMQVQLAPEAKIASDFHFIGAIFAVVGFVSAQRGRPVLGQPPLGLFAGQPAWALALLGQALRERDEEVYAGLNLVKVHGLLGGVAGTAAADTGGEYVHVLVLGGELTALEAGVDSVQRGSRCPSSP